MKLTKKEFNKTINFMLMHNIISSQEYNNILIKSLPYLK